MRRCGLCNQNHHTWIHQLDHEDLSHPQPELTNPVSLGTISGEGENLLGTAVAEVQSAQGLFLPIRLVTGSSSQHSFMTTECAKRLGLTIEPCDQTITGIGQTPIVNTIGRTDVTIRSRISSLALNELSTQAIVVPKITGNLPQVPLPVAQLKSYKSYALADPDFWKPGPIDFLLGGDLYFDIINGKSVTIDKKIPRLLPTLFGYIIAGPMLSVPMSPKSSSFLIQSREQLSAIMDKFWAIEEVDAVKITSEEDEHVERHYQKTYYRLSSGRYVVSLPVKENISSLQNPEDQALKRLYNLENKLNKNPSLKEQYHLFMKEYLDLGHMCVVPPGVITRYTIPHHPVFKEQDGKIKIRVVFDASCRTVTGSLNDRLYVEPKLQNDISEIISQFRTHRIAFTTDIVKMYRQILMHLPDRRYQHIFWRFDPSEAVQKYELCTVTYGEGPAAFHAQRTIIQHVKNNGQRYPLASRALLEDIYADDIATGVASVEEAIHLQREHIELMTSRGFDLSKWARNSSKLLNQFEEVQCQTAARTRHQTGTSGAFTLKDTREANNALLRVVQRHLKIDKRHLQSLNAFLGDDGLLRVDGRLQHSHLSYNAKHPIIISGKSHFTKIIIDHYHLVNMYMGPTALQAFLSGFRPNIGL
nr:uncharacterized protein LOC112210386 [Halyomorpha halys]